MTGLCLRVKSRAGERVMGAFLLLVVSTAVVVITITLRLAWREHRDRRLGARLGYSWGSSYNDRQQAARAAEREANHLRRAGWIG
jgi:hypothetical protein